MRTVREPLTSEISRAQPIGFTEADVDVEALRSLTVQRSVVTDYPTAAAVERGVVIYLANRLEVAARADRASVLSELCHVLGHGPGVFVVRDAVPPETVAAATRVFDDLIAAQRATGIGVGDHFAKAGANDRIWNSHEKLAVAAPEVFVDYYASTAIELASLAWLGPGYQVTSQVNLVRPGGDAQSGHRDYHLGFMSDEQAKAFPRHVHVVSPYLTLQGAIAHSDMAVESGATKLLPHSHKLPVGYLAWRHPDVIDLFESACVQLRLSVGDALFFNPALLHAAGANRTKDVMRMGNLLQVSSAMGRAMESVDRARIVRAIYPTLRQRVANGWDAASVDRVVAASAEGYAFPTNLDRDPAVGGLAPLSQADVLRSSLTAAWSADELDTELTAAEFRRRPS